MPYKSEAQRRYLEANHPELAKQFEAETPITARLPPRVGRAKKSQRGESRLSRSSKLS